MTSSATYPSDPLLTAGDAFMRVGKHRKAHRAYIDSWNDEGRHLDDPTRQVWHLLAASHAHLRAGHPDGATEGCGIIIKLHSESGLVVGNPLFHLVAGLAAHELGNVDSATDNLARALICGGPGMFVGEDPRYLKDLKRILLPPPELGTWKGYTGLSRDLLNGATGYLAELLAYRLGTPPPYASPDH